MAAWHTVPTHSPPVALGAPVLGAAAVPGSPRPPCRGDGTLPVPFLRQKTSLSPFQKASGSSPEPAFGAGRADGRRGVVYKQGSACKPAPRGAVPLDTAAGLWSCPWSCPGPAVPAVSPVAVPPALCRSIPGEALGGVPKSILGRCRPVEGKLPRHARPRCFQCHAVVA